MGYGYIGLNVGNTATLTSALYVDAGANVGIKNTSPTVALDVTGDIKASGNVITASVKTSSIFDPLAANARIQIVNGGGTYFNTTGTNQTAFAFLYAGTGDLSTDTAHRIATLDSAGNFTATGGMTANSYNSFNTYISAATNGGTYDITGMTSVNYNAIFLISAFVQTSAGVGTGNWAYRMIQSFYNGSVWTYTDMINNGQAPYYTVTQNSDGSIKWRIVNNTNGTIVRVYVTIFKQSGGT
jgi:hypothetical protein